MKKFHARRIFAAFSLIFCSFAALSCPLAKQSAPKEVSHISEAPPTQSAVTLASAAKAPAMSRGYTVKTHEGTVCVFSHDGTLLIRTLINVSKLRSRDAAALKDGIFATDIAQVWQLLEDFGS